MKKVISLVLAAAMLFSFAVPSFAAEEKHDPKSCKNIPVVLVRGMDFDGLYLDYGTENQQLAINTNAKMIVSGVLKTLGKSIFNLSLDDFMAGVEELVCDIFGYLTIDENGNSAYNVTAPEYLESADNYDELCNGEGAELGMVRACIETFGDGHTYYVNYDWRLDPYVVADDINAAVKTTIKNTGHDKVNLVCCSMGGIMTVAYLTEYGYNDINKCLFMSSTVGGAQVASDLLCGKVDITANNLYNLLKNAVKDKKGLSLLVDGLEKAGAFDFLTEITDFILENYKDEVFEKAIIPIFGRTLTLWGLCQPEDYDAAIGYMLGGRTKENAAFLKRTDALQKMMAGKEKLINKMIKSGVKVAVVAHYGTPVVPVYENAHFNGDGVLETYQMSCYATVAPYGENLGDDYKAKNPKYLSPDNTVDLSTALFPEYTYIIKGAPHVSGSYGTDYSDFFIWLLSCEGNFYAGVNPKYPQFMISDSSETLKHF